jgi:hypothetical protein
MINTKKGFASVFIVVLILLVLAAAGGVYVLNQDTKESGVVPTKPQSLTPTPAPQPTVLPSSEPIVPTVPKASGSNQPNTVSSCDKNAVGENKFVGCFWSAESLEKLSPATPWNAQTFQKTLSVAPSGPATISPVPQSATMLNYKRSVLPADATTILWKGDFTFTPGRYVFFSRSFGGSKVTFDGVTKVDYAPHPYGEKILEDWFVVDFSTVTKVRIEIAHYENRRYTRPDKDVYDWGGSVEFGTDSSRSLVNGALCNVDYQKTPQFGSFAQQVLSSCERSVMKIEQKFSRGKFAPPYKVRLYEYANYNIDQRAAGSWGGAELNVSHFTQYPDELDIILAHELTHVLQGVGLPVTYPQSDKTAYFMIEAIADYGSYIANGHVFPNCYRANPKNVLSNCSFELIRFLESKYESTIASRILETLRSGSSVDNFLQQTTGKTLDQLISDCFVGSSCSVPDQRG